MLEFHNQIKLRFKKFKYVNCLNPKKSRIKKFQKNRKSYKNQEKNKKKLESRKSSSRYSAEPSGASLQAASTIGHALGSESKGIIAATPWPPHTDSRFWTVRSSQLANLVRSFWFTGS
jgi:hypothetical protein